MSQDVFPIQIRVAVFSRTRLCANAEIGVPRGKTACLRRNSCTHSHFHTPCHVALVYPQSFPHFPSFLLLPPVIPAKAGIVLRQQEMDFSIVHNV